MAPDDSRPGGLRESATDGDRETHPADGRPRRSIGLRSEVVTYPAGPDRRTIYPPEATGVKRMSTWLTANCDAFVDLEAVR